MKNWISMMCFFLSLVASAQTENTEAIKDTSKNKDIYKVPFFRNRISVDYLGFSNISIGSVSLNYERTIYRSKKFDAISLKLGFGVDFTRTLATWGYRLPIAIFYSKGNKNVLRVGVGYFLNNYGYNFIERYPPPKISNWVGTEIGYNRIMLKRVWIGIYIANNFNLNYRLEPDGSFFGHELNSNYNYFLLPGIKCEYIF